MPFVSIKSAVNQSTLNQNAIALIANKSEDGDFRAQGVSVCQAILFAYIFAKTK